MIRLLLILALALAPFLAIAYTGQDADFRFSVGQPSLIIDADTDCNTTAVARYAFVLGQPAIVYEAGATCNAAAGGGFITPVNSIIWISEDQ